MELLNEHGTSKNVDNLSIYSTAQYFKNDASESK